MNSDFLSRIFASEGSHIPNVSNKILEIINQTNVLKMDVKTVVQYSSTQFSPLIKENDSLISNSNKLLTEMKEMEELLEGEIKTELSGCAEELRTLSSSLKEIKLFLQVVEKLLELNLSVRKAREKLEKKEFYQCSELVVILLALIKDNSENLKSVEVFRILSQEVVLTYELLLHQISEIWSECICISVRNSFVEISIQPCNSLSQILKASDNLKSNLIEKKFSQSLLNKILKKVILNRSKITSKVSDANAFLSIELIHDSNKPNYLEVFNNSKIIIEFLKSNIDIEIQDGIGFLSRVGKQIAHDFIDCVMQNCLTDTIPTSSDDLDNYKIVVENAEEFEKILQESGFLPGSSSLVNYAKNINVLFANKFCQSYLHRARMIMKKDLHNVTKSEDIVSNLNVLAEAHKCKLKEILNTQEDIVSFPNCLISRQAEELMSLVHSMMKEVEKNLDFCSIRLFYTVRNIFEMYSAIVPLHHKKFLETLPNQIALFHNNCVYFTHSLIRLTTEHSNKMPGVLEDHFLILLEEAIILKLLASETLEVTVTNQRNQLIYILRDSGFATLNENPTLDPNSEKSIRQCIRHLQILNSVWSDVLPLSVYNRVIGFLLDTIIEELIGLIISVEDISCQTASDLVSSFSVVLDKAIILFPEPEEIYRHCKKWQKFKEFVLILKGSLRDIDDRWANGMGPLAVEFTPEQVKHLIRALFQNSERRAALLSRIR